MLKAIVYQGVTIVRHPKRERYVALCPLTTGVWGPFPSLFHAKKEIRSWGLSGGQPPRQAAKEHA